MSIEHVLAVVPVTDLPRAAAWYERLLNRPPDNRPMEGLVEWRATASGWVQVFTDAERAGATSVNFAVDDLDQHLADLAGRGLNSEPIQTASKGVHLSTITDPDGNRITFIGNFRIDY